MRISSSETHIVLEDCGDTLCFSKLTGQLESVAGTPSDAVSCGSAILLLGKLDIEGTSHLLVVSQSTVQGYFRRASVLLPIHRIDQVRCVPLSSSASRIKEILEESQGVGKFKQGTGKLLKFVQDKVGNPVTTMDEVLRLFNDHPDFYFCRERDITHSTQRYFSCVNKCDSRFFWNRSILACILSSDLAPAKKAQWAIPIMQGFVTTVDLSLQEGSLVEATLSLTLISRRSVHRAGARYLRRGIDMDANVANFVETELILNIFDHHLSYVQIRGSIPLFWSQKGFKYRPPLSIDKSLEESMPQFEKHMSEIMTDYGTSLVVVNLVDQTGRELKLARSYLETALNWSNEQLSFVSYDLHHHCRGLRYDKLSNLVCSIEDLLSDIGFCWVDKTGEVVRKQNGIVRTNCVDCLDRTNVVQGVLSQFICMRQAQRLGIFGPLSEPPEAIVSALQTMWADNGDALSTQYAGTAALKGDVTRSGERKLAGIMKDGYNSASRYYLSHVRDSARQKAMNLLLGVEDQGSESMSTSPLEDSDEEEDESISRLVNETSHFLLPDNAIVVGGWGLVDYRQSNDTVDSVVLLTRTHIHVALYDDETEKLVDVRIIPLEDVETLEVGRPSRSARTHLKVTAKGQSFGTWSWRASKTRLFNNVAIRLKTVEEADEYVESVAEQISVAFEMFTGQHLEIHRPQRLNLDDRQGGVARKAVASFTAAFRLKSRRPSPTLNAVTGPREEIKSTKEEISAEQINDVLVDDMSDSLRSKHLSLPQEMRTSTSDGLLYMRDGLVSRLKGLRPPLKPDLPQKEQPTTDVFECLRPLMSKSKTNWILL